MKKLSNIFLLLSLVYALCVVVFIVQTPQNKVKAATSHIVISQLQTTGATANDEFVELYNPTDVTINLSKWRLSRETQSGTSSATLVASMSGSIAPRGYFLVTSNESLSSSSADLKYSNSSTHVASNNTVLLYSDAGITLVDKVGLGTALDFESTSSDNPVTNGSVMRKASANSTASSLSIGGTEAGFGNGYDTDNNANDFVQLATSQPRNTASPQAQPTPTSTPTPTVVPTNTPAPTITPLPTATPTPTIKPTAAPTLIPTSTPMPTATPTPQPTATPIPTMTPTPTVKPTSVPSPTLVPTATPTTIPTVVPTDIPTSTPVPTQIPTPTPTGTVIVSKTLTSHLSLICLKTDRTLTVLGIHLILPGVSCSLIRN